MSEMQPPSVQAYIESHPGVYAADPTNPEAGYQVRKPGDSEALASIISPESSTEAAAQHLGDMATSQTVEVVDDARHTNERLGVASQAAEILKGAYPEYLGMTIYGSTARGEAKEASDIDGMIFMQVTDESRVQDGSSSNGHTTYTATQGSLVGSELFTPNVDLNYKVEINETLAQKGVDIKGTRFDEGMEVYPISERIIDDQVAHTLEVARQYNESKEVSVLTQAGSVARNVRGLFFREIDDSGLSAYRDRVVKELRDSPDGAVAWAMVRYWVGYYENGRNSQAGNLPHRHFPATIQEAADYYLKPQQ